MVNVPECLGQLFLRFRKVAVQQIAVAFGLPIPSASTASFSRRERGVRFLMKDGPIVAQPSSTGFGKTMRTTSGTGSAAFIISSCLSTNSTTPFSFSYALRGFTDILNFSSGMSLTVSILNSVRNPGSDLRPGKSGKQRTSNAFSRLLRPGLTLSQHDWKYHDTACFTSSQDLADMHQHY